MHAFNQRMLCRIKFLKRIYFVNHKQGDFGIEFFFIAHLRIFCNQRNGLRQAPAHQRANGRRDESLESGIVAHTRAGGCFYLESLGLHSMFIRTCSQHIKDFSRNQNGSRELAPVSWS
jgi:hypothetical protein